MTSTPVTLGNVPVGKAHPPVFLAEIGTFFNQDMEIAANMAREVVSAGKAQSSIPVILKGEILHSPDVCLDDDTIETYVSKQGIVKTERFRDVIERKVISLGQYEKLFAIATDAGLPFVVSVYDFIGADFAAANGCAAIKIASANLDHIPLIRHAARQGLPLVIDTGRAKMNEVVHALETANGEGCSSIILEHSPDGHPALPKAHNLRTIETFLKAFDLPVGLSDHHVGEEMLYAAVALGASVIEKGVTFDEMALEQDISYAMAFERLPATLQRIRNCWEALGSEFRDITTPIEGVIGTSQRQGLVAKTALAPNDRLSLENVRFAWPAVGIPVSAWDMAEGRRVIEPLEAGTPIQWKDIQADAP